MARILIDGRFVGVGDSLSRYTLEITKGILKLDKENDYTLLVRPEGKKIAEQFFSKEWGVGREEKNTPNSQHLTPNLYLNVQDIPHYSISEQTKLLKYLNQEKFDLVHFTQFNHPIKYRGKYVVTIHDLTMIGHLHHNLPHKRLAFGMTMKSAVKSSAKIIAISEATKQDILDYYKKTPVDKIKVIYHGIDHDTFNMSAKSQVDKIHKFEKSYKINGEYILYTGMWKKHKNLLRLLLAFEKYKKNNLSNDIQLVLLGKIDRREPQVIHEINRINEEISFLIENKELPERNKTNNKPENLIIKQFNNQAILATGFISEEELPIACAGAFAYCIPSLSEGFGWPPLEAMACGTPVIASSESSIPEICGEAPLYFDPYKVDDIVQKIEKITTDIELRKKMIKKGLEQVKGYHWEECAQKTLAVYKSLL